MVYNEVGFNPTVITFVATNVVEVSSRIRVVFLEHADS